MNRPNHRLSPYTHPSLSSLPSGLQARLFLCKFLVLENQPGTILAFATLFFTKQLFLFLNRRGSLICLGFLQASSRPSNLIGSSSAATTSYSKPAFGQLTRCGHWHVPSFACCRKYHLTTPPHQASSIKQLAASPSRNSPMPETIIRRGPSLQLEATACSPSPPPNTAQISVAQLLLPSLIAPHTSTPIQAIGSFSHSPRHLQSLRIASPRLPLSLQGWVVWVPAVPSFFFLLKQKPNLSWSCPSAVCHGALQSRL